MTTVRGETTPMNFDQDIPEGMMEEEEIMTMSLPAATLSKSWSVQAAHVPTYTGGKVQHCYTAGVAPVASDDADPQEPTPFMLLPVNGDLAVVDARKGIKIRTIRMGDDGVVNDVADEDDDEEEGVDADAIVSYALSGNDQLLVTASRNQLLRQYALSISSWKVRRPAPVQKLWGRSGHSLPISHMEFHVSNIFLATASVDGTVRVWDVRGAYVTHVFRPMKGGAQDRGGGMDAVTAISWKNDASQLVISIGRDDGSITIHDLRDEDQAIVLRDHVSAVTCMEWCPHIEDIFVSAGRDAVLNTWQIVREASALTKKKKKGMPSKLNYMRVHTLPVYEQIEGMVLFPSPTSELEVATAGSKGVLRVWKAHLQKSSSTISSFARVTEQSESDSFGADRGGYMQLKRANMPEGADGEEKLIVADAEHNLSFLSLTTRKQERLISVERTIVGHNDEILDISVIPFGRSEASSTRIAVATNSAQVRLFDLGTFSCDVLDGHTATVLCVDVSPCGRYLSTCGKDSTMRLWHLGRHRCVASAIGHTEAIGSSALSRKIARYDVTGKAAMNGGGSFVVTASKDRTIKRWNLPGSSVLDELGTSDTADKIPLQAFASARAHDKDINIVSVAPNDSLVATGSQDKTVKLWRATDLTLQATLKGHRRGVWDCQFSQFDRVLATASGDRTVKLWSLGDYSCVRTFQGHVASVLRVRFLSAGLQLLSSGADGLVKLWTIRTNECEATMDGHNDKVWALDLSPDGKSFISGGADSQIVIWNDTTQQEEDTKRATEEENILMEQKLANHLRHKEFEQALEIALELEKPLQALKVMNSVVETEVQKGRNGLETMQRHVKGWSISRTTQMLRYCRDWNTRARNCSMAMLVVKAVITSVPAHTLAAADGVPEILAGITPYAERHFQRLDRLHASTYLLDFALFSMGSLDATQDESKAYAHWESTAKLVLPPQKVDGRIQVGGSTFVGRDNLAEYEEEEDDDVVTIGESSDSSDDDSTTPETPEDEANNDSQDGEGEASSSESSSGSNS